MRDPPALTEWCDACDRETCHDVSISIRTESTESMNAQYSREPYRVSVCRECGHERSVRMNNVSSTRE